MPKKGPGKKKPKKRRRTHPLHKTMRDRANRIVTRARAVLQEAVESQKEARRIARALDALVSQVGSSRELAAARAELGEAVAWVEEHKRKASDAVSKAARSAKAKTARNANEWIHRISLLAAKAVRQKQLAVQYGRLCHAIVRRYPIEQAD
jgi:hypothetical protein